MGAPLPDQSRARFDAASIFSLRLEAALVLVVLCAVALLSATPVPVPEFAAREVQAPTAAQTVGEWTIVQTILPGGPGVNTYDTTITQNGARVDGLDIRLQMLHPASDTRGDWHRVEAAEPGLYVTAGDEIGTAGRWWSLLDITADNGEARRVAFEWSISREASVIESVQPNAGHIAALAGVLVAVGIAAYPYGARLLNILNLDTFSVTVTVGAVAATAAVLFIGYVVVQNTRQNYAETLNPPPAVVNAVLPTQASLNRGQELYTEHCIGWQTVPRDFNALRERLPRTRDEELYRATLEGWRGLPPCTGDLSLYQRWDIVNYVRTFGQV